MTENSHHIDLEQDQDTPAELAGSYSLTETGYSSPCWIWHGAKNDRGYGSTTYKGSRGYVHRISYEVRNGSIGEGLTIDHLCRVPSCFNPDHLEAVTHAENCRRGARAKLTMEDAMAIRASDEPPRMLAERYGVCVPHIIRIRKGQFWV